MKVIIELFESMLSGYLGKLFLLGLIIALISVAVVLYKENPERFSTSNTAQSENTEAISDPEMLKAAEFYANATCVLSDPEYWKSLFDEDVPESDSDAFIKANGYENEQEAQEAVKKYKDSSTFRDNVKLLIDERCKEAFAATGLNLDDLLDNS